LLFRIAANIIVYFHPDLFLFDDLNFLRSAIYRAQQLPRSAPHRWRGPKCWLAADREYYLATRRNMNVPEDGKNSISMTIHRRTLHENYQ